MPGWQVLYILPIVALLLVAAVIAFCLWKGLPRLAMSLLSHVHVRHDFPDDSAVHFQHTENIFEEPSVKINTEVCDISLAGREIGLILCGSDFSVPQDVVKALRQEIEKKGGKAFDLFGDQHLRSLENLRAYLKLRTIHLMCVASVMYTPLRASKEMFVMVTYWQWHSVKGLTDTQKVVQAADIYGEDKLDVTIEKLLSNVPDIDIAETIAQGYIEEYMQQLTEKMMQARKL